MRVVDEAVGLEHAAHAVDARLSVAREQLLSRQTLLRVLRVQVEGEPRDLSAEPALEPVGRRLADAAERSDVVGPDEDFVLAHSTSSRRMSSTVSRRRMTRASPFGTSTAAGPRHGVVVRAHAERVGARRCDGEEVSAARLGKARALDHHVGRLAVLTADRVRRRPAARPRGWRAAQSGARRRAADAGCRTCRRRRRRT